jgi:hypothetical protein
MPTTIADLHRSRLEALLAVEIEFQRKVLALSNQRISEIKKLIAGVDELHIDVDGDETIASLLPSKSTPVAPIKSNTAPAAIPSTSKAQKKKHKKAAPPVKPIRVANGKPPRLIDAIQIVIGNKYMKAQQIYDLLKSKKWLPPNSRDPLGYIRFTLSSEGDIFQRKEGERGIYHLDPSNPYYTGRSPTSKPPKPQAANDESEPAPKSSVTASPSPKEVIAPEEPPREGSEAPPPISVAESFSTVDQMMTGEIPVD